MTDVSLRRVVADALAHFTAPSLLGPAVELFGALGYRSNRRFDVNPAGGHALLEALGLTGKLNAERALLAHWHAAELIFQLTAEEILTTGQMALFDTRQVDQTRIESYLFLAIDLSGASYTRTELATITREINRHLLMPVLVLFRHGATLTFAVIDRRLHKLNEARDVLEKVTLIKDIAFAQPHRAHIEILADLCLPQLAREASVSNFVELHRAWRTVLDSSALNRRFYREVANWYFWAVEQVEFPADAQADRAVRNATSLIRMITRVIFVWFLKEKGLIPDDLFNPRRLREILTSLAHDESSYYQAILQNLFFATLNQEMNTPQRPTNRTFRGEGRQHYNITTLYRHKARFRDPEAALTLFARIPFLNGGLFECLDKADADGKVIRIDGFSDRADVPLRVPNALFFGAEHAVDLNATYGTSGKHYQAAGLITILQRYKFTVAENTPIEEEVALDPELLGQVFENLLAAYNPETQTTARKQTGSFYTPRPIVNYMVDEALVAYLQVALSRLEAGATLPVAPTSSREDDAEDTLFFDPHADIEIYQRNLPHWRQSGATYFVTFRLADSLPQEKLCQYMDERDLWLRLHPEPRTPAQQAEYHRRFSNTIQQWLDAGAGACHLSTPQVAQIVANALNHFEGQRYRLGAWVVMPNHVHVLVTPIGDHQLSAILHSWKSFTSNAINKLLGREGTLWQHESYDRIVRSPAQLARIEQYIAENPARAGLEEAPASSVAPASSRIDPSRLESGATESVAPASSQDGITERLRDLMTYTEADHGFSPDEVRHLIIAINNVKILDPAAGSGAFPMGVLQKLVHLLTRLDPDNTRWKEQQRARAIEETKGAFEIGDRAERERRLLDINEAFEYNSSDYGRKLYLIENCIYGVDIQPIAIQIAKLRCFISLVVDQRIDDTRENRGIRPLPNLETKFVAANTLVGITSQGMLRSDEVLRLEKELATVRSYHFSARTPTTKRKYRDRDRELRMHLGDRLEREGIPGPIASQLASWDPYDQNAFASFFDSEWMFGLHDGFDIIIANPPYVRQEQISELKPYFKVAYPETYSGTADLFVYFFHQGINLLRQGGRLVYITNNKWLRAGYGENLRGFLAAQTVVEQLVDFGHSPIFEGADVFPAIVVLEKPTNGVPTNRQVCVADFPRAALGGDALDVYIREHSRAVPQARLSRTAWSLEHAKIDDLMAKIRNAGVPLAEFAGVKPYRGAVSGFNKAFWIDAHTKNRLVRDNPRSAEIIKPYLRGQDVKRWSPEWADLWMIFTGQGIAIEKYPGIQQHLVQYRDALEQRAGKQAWWQFQSAGTFHHLYAQPKIIWKDLSFHSEFCLDESGLYTNDLCFTLPVKDYWLITVLNSPLMWSFMWRNVIHGKDEVLRLKNIYTEQLPIAPPTDTTRAEVEPAVARLIAITQADQQARRELHHWLRNEFGIEKLGQKLEAFDQLSAGAFADEVAKRRPKGSVALTTGARQSLHRTHNEHATPMQQRATEARVLELRLADLVNAAYGLTPEEIVLMWETAPPRMPVGTS